MKKALPLMFVIAAAGFSGCKKSEPPPPPPAPVAASTPTPVADPNAVNPAELEGASTGNQPVAASHEEK